MRLSVLDRFLAAHADPRGAALVTDLAEGRQWFVGANGIAAAEDAPALSEAEVKLVDEAVRRGRSTMVTTATGRRLFVEIAAPAARLVIVGAVHIAQALATIAATAGFAVTVIDPRERFSAAARFPGVAVVTGWPDEALASLHPDRNTAIVVLSHDAKIDDPALIAALQSRSFYIGALGSRRNQAKRRERLMAAGFGADQVARIHGPVGLDIGALTPGEIAVAIAAEMIAALRGDRASPSHPS